MEWPGMMGKAVFGLVAVLLAVVAACQAGVGQVERTGTLEGQVSIGPIFPVEREGEKREVPPEVYAARKVMVYDRTGRKLVKQVDLGDDGGYSVALAAGTYVVDINRVGIDHSDEVPREILIRPGETVVLDIDIDTGIR